MCQLALTSDDRPGGPRRRDRAVQVEILEADGEDFADADSSKYVLAESADSG